VDNFIFPDMADFDVTCHSAECENSEITIRVSAVADSPHITCGPCGIQIEDVIPVGEEG
jgi:hypothetical protein